MHTLSNPKPWEVDGSTLSNKTPLSRLTRPFVFRGSDFDCRFDLSLYQILNFHQTHFRKLASRSKEACSCPQVLRCQTITVENPSISTLEFAQKSWMESVADNGAINLTLTTRSIHIGNTSDTTIAQLIYKNKYPLITYTQIYCHVDLTTRKTMPICNAERNKIENELSLIKSETKKQNLLNYRQNLRESINIITKSLKDMHINKNYLFKIRLQLFYTDIDHVWHVNQAIYGRQIENALLHYDKKIYDSKYNVKQITLNYIQEITIDRNKCQMNNALDFCTVKICIDTENKNKHVMQRNIIGIIEKDNILCVQFKLILIPYKHERLFPINSRL